MDRGLNDGGKLVMIFPDFFSETQAKRERFRQCRKALHERKMKFSLLYRALSISVGEGASQTFDYPKTLIYLPHTKKGRIHAV